MKIRYLVSSYIEKFYGEKTKERTNKYILIHKRGKDLDNNGYLGTYRKIHAWVEFDSLGELHEYLDEDVAKSERNAFAVYKRYEKLPPNKSTNIGE